MKTRRAVVNFVINETLENYSGVIINIVGKYSEQKAIEQITKKGYKGTFSIYLGYGL